MPTRSMASAPWPRPGTRLRQDGLRVPPRNPNPSLEELERGLAIDQHDMENVCRTHPELFYRVSRELVLAKSRRDQLQQHSKEIEAEVETDLRVAAESREGRVTDKAIEALRRGNPEVQRIRRELLDAELEVSRWEALKEAFTSRGFMIRDMIQLYLANYYGSDMDRNSRDVRSVDAAAARASLSERRQQRHVRSRE